MERLEAFWSDVEDCSQGKDDKRFVTRSDLVGLISDRFGVCRNTIWSYTKLLEELEWIRKMKSGRGFFLVRPEDGGDGK